MSVYIFSHDGASIYGDNITSTTILHQLDSSSSDTHKLSTIELKMMTTSSEIIAYGDKIRSELEEIRQIYIDNPHVATTEYNKFLNVQTEILGHVDDLIYLYRHLQDASKLTANRKEATKNKIYNVGLKLRSLIQSYNTSGIFTNKNFSVAVPFKNSRDEIIRSRLLQEIGEF